MEYEVVKYFSYYGLECFDGETFPYSLFGVCDNVEIEVLVKDGYIRKIDEPDAIKPLNSIKRMSEYRKREYKKVRDEELIRINNQIQNVQFIVENSILDSENRMVLQYLIKKYNMRITLLESFEDFDDIKNNEELYDLLKKLNSEIWIIQKKFDL